MLAKIPRCAEVFGRINSSEARTLEPYRVPVPSLPPRSHRQHDALPGSRSSVSSTGGPAASTSTGEPESVLAAFPNTPRTPAILAEDGRGALTVLHGARGRAAWAAEGLEQLEAAGGGLARVQKLVGRLRDVAVVAVDRGLQPADRATLQRQVDLMLTEIDTIAEGTTLDENLLHRGSTIGASEGTSRTPFRALSTGTLGLAGLAVRSSDQALAASGALELAGRRLDRTAGTLSNATARLQDTLDGVIRPEKTATGETAIGSGTAALSATMLLRAQLASHPWEAAQAQGGLDVGRTRWLLDSSPR